MVLIARPYVTPQDPSQWVKPMYSNRDRFWQIFWYTMTRLGALSHDWGGNSSVYVFKFKRWLNMIYVTDLVENKQKHPNKRLGI